MSVQQEELINYFQEHGILQRLRELLDQLLRIKPLPADPLMHILFGLGCPLIPLAQMKSLECQVSRAQDEVRYLRRILIKLGGKKELYDSDSDEDEYVGSIRAMSLPNCRPKSRKECKALQAPQSIMEASIGIKQEMNLEPLEEVPCSSCSIRNNLQQS